MKCASPFTSPHRPPISTLDTPRRPSHSAQARPQQAGGQPGFAQSSSSPKCGTEEGGVHQGGEGQAAGKQLERFSGFLPAVPHTVELNIKFFKKNWFSVFFKLLLFPPTPPSRKFICNQGLLQIC